MGLVRGAVCAALACVIGCGQSDPSDRKPGDGTGTLEDPASPGAVVDAGQSDPTYNGSIGTDQNGNDICKELAVRAAPTIPDMLIVQDRSGSMGPGSPIPVGLDCTKLENFETCQDLGVDCTSVLYANTQACGGTQAGRTDRWTPSISALKRITADLEQKIRFGLMTFPSDNSCGTGRLLVPTDLGTAARIASALDKTQPGGGTPTGATLKAALEKLGGAQQASPDVAAVPRFVLLATDGQPTCPSGRGSSQASQAQLQSDLKLTLEALDALRAAGVKTYVLGYDAQLDPQLQSALGEMAQHGGTDNYYQVQDEASVLAAFEKIAGEVVSCSYQLEQEPPDPSYVLIELDGQQLNLNDPNGWSINGKAVTLQGKACATLQDRGEHLVSVRVLCQVVDPV